MTYLLGALISLGQGYCLLKILLGAQRPKLAWMILTGLLLGLALSAQVTFTSFLLFNQFSAPLVITANLAIFAGLLFRSLRQSSTQNPFCPWHELDTKDIAALVFLALLLVPVAIHASIFPYGGWDAWSCWNLKARMLFIGHDAWRNMFDPMLWRSNTAYPLLLPLMNTWLWGFGSAPIPQVPLVVSCLITFLVSGILYFSIKELTGRTWAILAPAWLLSIFFIIQLSSSQYSDLLVGTFLLVAVAAFFLYQKHQNAGFLKVAIFALGCLSFTKSEGLVLSIIALAGISLPLILSLKDRHILKTSAGGLLLAITGSFFISGIFQVFLAPNSHTLINGFVSAEKPTSLERLAVVFVFFGQEILTPKWNGLWLLTIGGLVVSWKNSLSARLWVIPVILIVYLAAVFGVYWLNTFFEIVWWLGTTMNRILFALTPTVIFWLFLAVLERPAIKNAP